VGREQQLIPDYRWTALLKLMNTELPGMLVLTVCLFLTYLITVPLTGQAPTQIFSKEKSVTNKILLSNEHSA